MSLLLKKTPLTYKKTKVTNRIVQNGFAVADVWMNTTSKGANPYLTFRVLALHHLPYQRANFRKSLGDQFTLPSRMIKPNDLVIPYQRNTKVYLETYPFCSNTYLFESCCSNKLRVRSQTL